MKIMRHVRLKAVQLALLSAPLMAACGDAGSRGDSGTPSAGAALNFDRLRCASRTGRRTCELYNASVAELVANPREFHGRKVRVIGFVHIEPEASALYPGEADYRHAIHRNGVWLNAPAGADSLSDRYVRVEATFDASSQGNFSKWSGTLKDVTHLSHWRGADAPASESRVPATDSLSSTSGDGSSADCTAVCLASPRGDLPREWRARTRSS